MPKSPMLTQVQQKEENLVSELGIHVSSITIYFSFTENFTFIKVWNTTAHKELFQYAVSTLSNLTKPL